MAIAFGSTIQNMLTARKITGFSSSEYFAKRSRKIFETSENFNLRTSLGTDLIPMEMRDKIAATVSSSSVAFKVVI